jgi:hypothetical protein
VSCRKTALLVFFALAATLSFFVAVFFLAPPFLRAFLGAISKLLLGSGVASSVLRYGYEIILVE